jgi:peptidoglycan/LPS O-acetylase OafA/YrhL
MPRGDEGAARSPRATNSAITTSDPALRSTPAFLGKIESVRGIAALCVAFTHTMGIMLPDDQLPLLDQATVRGFLIALFHAACNGETAVMVFFIMSGLVIARSLDGKALSPSAYAFFLVRRGCRFYPASTVALLGVIVLAWLFLMDSEPIDFAAIPAFDGYPSWIFDWYNGTVFNPLKWSSVIGNLALLSWSLNLVAWSLYVEICVAPLLPLLHNLARRDDGLLDAGICALLLAIAVYSWGSAWCEFWFVFHLGMLVENRGRDWARFLARCVGGGGRALALSYLALILPGMLTSGRPVAVVAAEALAAFSLISVIVWCDAPLRVLERPLLRWNGRVSYSFYLWHYFLLTVSVHLLYTTFAPETMAALEVVIFLAMVAVTVALGLAAAQLSYRFVELPGVRLGRWLERAWRRRRALLADAAAGAGGTIVE